MNQRSRVLFLDMDGVTNNILSVFCNDMKTPWIGGYDHNSFDSTTVQVLKRAAEVLEADFVLASTWGLGITPVTLTHLGTTLGVNFIGVVDDDLLTSRPIMIQRWLDSHPEITEYAVIDDEIDMYKDHPMLSHLIHIDDNTGISYKNLCDLGEIFDFDLFTRKKVVHDRKGCS